MKRIGVGILLGAMLAVVMSFYARAAVEKRFSLQGQQDMILKVPTSAGEPVLNYNIVVPTPPLVAGDDFCFGVIAKDRFFALRRSGANVEFLRVVGGKPSVMSALPFGAEENVTIQVRGPLCGIRTTSGKATVYSSDENIPPVWAWYGGATEVPVFRPLSAVMFADSFMREKSDEGEWRPQSGKWEIVSIPNPSRSANAFRLRGSSPETGVAVETLDLPDWDNYMAEMNIRLNLKPAKTSDTPGAGIVFDYRDAANYSALLVDPGAKTGGWARVTTFSPGGRKVLGEQTVNIRANQWYHLKVLQTFGRLVVEIDEQQILSISDPAISSGKFGLMVGDDCVAEFDDLDVRSLTPPETASLLTENGIWHTLGDVTLGKGSFTFAGTAPSFAFLPLALHDGARLTGKLNWREGSQGALMMGGIDPTARTLVLVPAARLATLAEFESGEFADGPRRISANAKQAGSCEFTVRVLKDYALIEVTGDIRMLETVPLKDGRLIFGIGGREGFSANTVEVSSFSRSRLMLWKNEIFTFETTMQNWNDDTLHWKRTGISKEGLTSCIDDRVFSSNIEVTVNLVEAQYTKPKWTVNAVLPKNNSSIDSGYLFGLDRKDDQYEAYFCKGGDELWRLPVEKADKIVSVGLVRNDRFFLCTINGEVFRTYSDPDDVPITMAGYKYGSIYVKPDQVIVNSDSTFEYVFNTAPSEWHAASGVWEVLNRWQCDPRWSFFSGDTEKDPAQRAISNLVLLWWRRKLVGDFTFEMYFGFKMDNSRGEKYSYARDVNVSLTSSPADLLSGYNFIVDGKMGTRLHAGSWIQREKVVVPAKPGLKPEPIRYIFDASNSHRFWFHYMLKRRGNTFTLTVTDMSRPNDLFEYTDPDPLPVDRLGIWSYDCPLMISRIRIQTSGRAPMVDLDQEIRSRPRSIYDTGNF
ncbi:MAG: hypothetical protein WC712_06235 [Candidatus Brocadiia bacterium]